MKLQRLLRLSLILCLLLAALPQPAQAQSATYYVAHNGSDSGGNGSSSRPWGTISYAIQQVPDDSLILVRPGTYTGQVKLRGNFTAGVTIRSEEPYRAKLRNDEQVLVTSGSASNIVFEGFDISHTGPGAGPLVGHIMGSRKLGLVHHITLRNNIFHDSYNSDLLKIDSSATDITVEFNVFYNQSGSDEHIDVNSASDIIIRRNIFFNDFEGSGRANRNETSSFVVVKDSSGNNDELIGSHNVRITANVFLGWQGLPSSTFIMLGEDGKPYFEATNITVENNLMLGNAQVEMRAPLGVYASKNVTFRNNTVSGDLPASAYAMLLSKAVSNPSNDNIRFYNNIWSDPTGTMGAMLGENNNDFSDTRPDRTRSFALDRNIYWNNGKPIPTDDDDLINYTNDAHRMVKNPGLRAPDGVPLPRWDEASGQFGGGAVSIRQAFIDLVNAYAAVPVSSPAVGAGDPANAPRTDILGKPRGTTTDIGAYQAVVSLAVHDTIGDGVVEIAWEDPQELPGDARWRITCANASGKVLSEVDDLPAETRSYRFTGLADYVAYTFTVLAILPDGSTLYTGRTHAMITDIFGFMPLSLANGD